MYTHSLCRYITLARPNEGLFIYVGLHSFNEFLDVYKLSLHSTNCVCMVYPHHHVAPSARISLTLSLSTPPCRTSLLAGLHGYILYLHKAAICRFELIAQPLLGHVKGSTRVHHLWSRPYFSSSFLHVCLI